MTATTTKTTDFWTTVESIGWGTKTTDYEAVKIDLMRQGRDVCCKLRNDFEAACNTLYRAAVVVGLDYCSDSWDDTVKHVVGLGRAEFARCVLDPQRLVDRYNAGDYRESFGYCIPWDDDFELLNIEALTKRAQGLAEYCDEMLGLSAEDDEEARVRGLNAQAFLGFNTVEDICRLSDLMAGTHDKWTDNLEEVKVLAERISNNPCHSTLGRLANKWWALNIVSDYALYQQIVAL
jgi:hypothetical protein